MGKKKSEEKEQVVFKSGFVAEGKFTMETIDLYAKVTQLMEEGKGESEECKAVKSDFFKYLQKDLTDSYEEQGIDVSKIDDEEEEKVLDLAYSMLGEIVKRTTTIHAPVILHIETKGDVSLYVIASARKGTVKVLRSYIEELHETKVSNPVKNFIATTMLMEDCCHSLMLSGHDPFRLSNKVLKNTMYVLGRILRDGDEETISRVIESYFDSLNGMVGLLDPNFEL